MKIERHADETQGTVPYKFAQHLAKIVIPEESIDRTMEPLKEQIMMASLAAAVTGKDARLVLTIECKDGIAHGVRSKMDCECYEDMKKMTEDEIVKAALPSIIKRCKAEAARKGLADIGALLQDILGGDDEDGDEETGDTKESQEQDAQAAS